MSFKLRGKTWTIIFRPFGQQIMMALKDCQSKRQAASIEAELMYALQSKKYDGLTGTARAACIRLFVNQGWEMPEELQPNIAQPPVKVFTLWDGVQLYVNDPSWCRSSIVDTNSLSCLLLFVVLALKGHGRKIAQFFLFSLTIIKNLDVFRDVFNGLLPSSVVTMKNQFTL